MKKIYSLSTVLVLCLGMLSISVKAQSFAVVGNGTTSNALNGYPAPYGNYYYGAKHQMFISAAELLASGVGGGISISKVGFEITNTNGAPPHIGWTVNVYTTTLTNPLASGYITTGLVGSSTPATATGVLGWNMTSISSFTWNGTENLVIETCFNNTSWVTSYSTRWTTNLTGSAVKTRYNYQDNSSACSSPLFLNATTTTRPNTRFEYVYNTPCAGTPGGNFVVTPTMAICPGSNADIGLGNTYTVGGISYQWQFSNTSSVGPWTTIGGANSSYYTTPNLTSNMYYSAIITCSAGGASTVAVSGQVVVAATTTSVVPYYESFEGINANDKLPNCSWAASATPSVTQTYLNTMSNNRQPHTGSKFGAFYGAGINGTYYFYTNGIQLNAGVTYSASVWFLTEYYGDDNFTEFELALGTTQSSTGLVSIASVTPAVATSYSSLSNTFTVGSSGLYYVAVKATSDGSYGAYYLSWDDLSIIVPCSLNTPSVTLSVSSPTICKGDVVTLTATGATDYSWNFGALGANVNDTPNSTTTYSVVATNSLSGCSVNLSQMVTVYNKPNVVVYTPKPSICAGETTNITAIALGANSFTWSSNANTAMISVSPTVTTTYNVLAANSDNCVGVGSQQILVNPNPTISVSSNASNQTQICKGEAVTLTGNGAVTYSWSANSLFISAPQAIINPTITTTYTVVGANASGCTAMVTHVQAVSECTGINQLAAGISGIKVYPNPTSGIFVVELNNGAAKTIQVSDITGRVVSSNTSNTDKVNVNISSLANGIYYVKIQSNNAVETIKIVKE